MDASSEKETYNGLVKALNSDDPQVVLQGLFGSISIYVSDMSLQY
jgi:hypothetical protein